MKFHLQQQAKRSLQATMTKRLTAAAAALLQATDDVPVVDLMAEASMIKAARSPVARANGGERAVLSLLCYFFFLHWLLPPRGWLSAPVGIVSMTL
jgi:hypothetical protein